MVRSAVATMVVSKADRKRHIQRLVVCQRGSFTENRRTTGAYPTAPKVMRNEPMLEWPSFDGRSATRALPVSAVEAISNRQNKKRCLKHEFLLGKVKWWERARHEFWYTSELGPYSCGLVLRLMIIETRRECSRSA